MMNRLIILGSLLSVVIFSIFYVGVISQYLPNAVNLILLGIIWWFVICEFIPRRLNGIIRKNKK
jgi:hypothetical protein